MSGDPAALGVEVGASDHARGEASARVTLVQYADFECPYSGAVYPLVREAQRRAGAVLRVVFRHFPRAQLHPNAQRAAEAAEAAAAQGAFWAMHDALFENQRALGEGDLLGYAAALGLDVARLARELGERRHAARVREHYVGGLRGRVDATPALFLDGVRLEGAWTSDALLAAVERAAG